MRKASTLTKNPSRRNQGRNDSIPVPLQPSLIEDVRDEETVVETKNITVKKPLREVDKTFLKIPINRKLIPKYFRLLRENGLSQVELKPGSEIRQKTSSVPCLNQKFDPAFQVTKEIEEVVVVSKNIHPAMEAALKLRERRLKRRKNRAMGIPIDPNDSDDSLAAELREITDEKLFPGIKFKSSNVPVFPEADLHKSMESSAKKTSSALLLPISVEQIQDHDAIDPIKVYSSFTPRAKSAFESVVVEKYQNYGVLTSFKGKNHLAKTQAKIASKEKIAQLKKTISDKQSQLQRLRQDLSQCKVHAQQGLTNCKFIIQEIFKTVSETPEIKINKFPILNAHSDMLPPLDQALLDPLKFHVPSAVHLSQNPKFRYLENIFRDSRDISLQADEAIPAIEKAIIEIENDLACLNLEELKIKPVADKLYESDLREKLELVVLKKLNHENNAKKEAAREKYQRNLEIFEKTEKSNRDANKAARDAETNLKNEKLKAQFIETRKIMHNESILKAQQINEAAKKREVALQALKSNIAKIRRGLTLVTEKRLPEQNDAEKNLFQGEAMLGESDLIRKARRNVVKLQQKKEELQQKKSNQQEKIKRALVEDLVRENNLAKEREAIEAQKYKANHALESLSRNSKCAFPVILPKTNEPIFIPKKEAKIVDISSKSAVPDILLDAAEGDAKTECCTASTSHLNPMISMKQNKRLPPPNHKIIKKVEHTSKSIISAPFTVEPNTIIFEDYDAQVTYSKKVLITNTSCRVNTFRLLPLPVDIAPYFEVIAPSPGKMSAGMICEATFIFRPPYGYDQDIFDVQVTFMAEHGGEFIVNIGCSTRKCLPTISSNVSKGVFSKVDSSKKYESEDDSFPVEFGACVLGDSIIRSIEVKNNGVLPTYYEVHAMQENGNIFKSGLDEFNSLFTLSKGANGILDGYSSSIIQISFIPPSTDFDLGTKSPKSEPIFIETLFTVQFEVLNTKPLYFHCKASILPTPLYIDKPILDFGVTVVGSTYRDRIVVKNISNIALKFWVEIQGMGNVTQSAPTSAQRSTASGKSSSHSGNLSDNFSMICTDGVDSNEDVDNSKSLSNSLNFSNESSEGDDTREERSMSRVSDSISSIRPIDKFLKNVINGRSSSLNVEISNLGVLEISPRLAFVQPNEPFSVWFKVHPSRSGYILLNKGANPFEIPIVIKYMNQGIPTPIPIKITGRVTTTDISLHIFGSSNSLVSFGDCALQEAKEFQLKITNMSILPQKVKFLASDQSLFLVNAPNKDSGGIIILPPQSSLFRNVRFEPANTGKYDIKLVCHSIWNRRFEIVCSGSGVKTPLFLKQSEIIFGSVALGTSKQATIEIFREQSERLFGAGHSKYIKSIPPKIDTCLSKASKSDSESSKINSRDNKQIDVICFQVGSPKITGIYKHNSLLVARNFRNSNSFSSEIEDLNQQVDSSVYRANPALLKSIRASQSPILGTFKFNPMNLDPAEIFSFRDPVLLNPRVNYLDAGESDYKAFENIESDLIGAYDSSDSAPVQISPQSGSLLRGQAISVKISVSPPHMTNLKNIDRINEILNNRAEDVDIQANPNSMVVNETAINEIETESSLPLEKIGKKKPTKDDKQRVREISTDAADLLSNSLKKPAIFMSLYDIPVRSTEDEENNIQKPHLATVYEVVDKTLLSVIVPFKIFKPDNPAFQIEKIHLHVVIPIVCPDIILITPESELLEFEIVPIGHQIVKTFRVYNSSKHEINLKSCLFLNSDCAFKIMSDLRIFPPGCHRNIQLGFKPHDSLVFKEVLKLKTETTQINLSLQGRGVTPLIKIEPKNQEIFLGDVIAGDSSSQNFTVQNLSSFELYLTLELTEVTNCKSLQKMKAFTGLVNFSKRNAFSVVPLFSRLDPNEVKEFTVKFSPDRESDSYFDVLNIRFWGGEQKINLTGRCWDTSSIFTGYIPFSRMIEEHTFGLSKFEYDYATQIWNGEFLNSLTESTLVRALEINDNDDNGQENEAAVNVSVQMNAAVKKPEKKKAKEKDVSSPGNSLSEEVIADILKVSRRSKIRFVSVECNWKLDVDSGKWFVDTQSLDLAILNVKSNAFTKPETKRAPIVDFTIESWNGSAEYNEIFKNFTTKFDSETPGIQKFVIEPDKGSLDIGNTKQLKLFLVDPVREFWASIKGFQEKLGAGGSNHSSEISSKSSTAEKVSRKFSLPALMSGPIANQAIEDPKDDKIFFDRPIMIQSHFKITVKGGIRYVEPKGVPAQSEARIWILNVHTVEPREF